MLLNCGVETLENLLDSKEIKPVNPKGNRPWIFLGRTHAEAEAPIWPPDVKNWFIGKDPKAGKDLREEDKGDDRGQDGWMASPTQWTWVWASSGKWWRTGKPDMLQSMGSQRVGHNWATEQQPMCSSDITMQPSLFIVIPCWITQSSTDYQKLWSIFSGNLQYKCLSTHLHFFPFLLFSSKSIWAHFKLFWWMPQKLRLQTEVMEFYKATRWWQCPVLTQSSVHKNISHSTNIEKKHLVLRNTLLKLMHSLENSNLKLYHYQSYTCVSVPAQSPPTLCNPMDCSPPGSSVHRILEARILEQVAISSSRGSSQPRDQTVVPCRCFTAEPSGKPIITSRTITQSELE